MSTPFDATPAGPAAYATESQIRFMVTLLAERDWNNQGLLLEKHMVRASVVRLAASWATRYMADETPAEISRMINNTVGRTSSTGEKINAILAHCSTGDSVQPGTEYAYKPLTKAAATAFVDWLLSLPRKAAEPIDTLSSGTEKQAAEQLTDGIWVLTDGRTVKVQEARNGSGNLYAKALGEDGRFEFVSGLISQVRKMAATGAARKMTLTEAAEYGALYGRCIECGRTLTDEDSIAAGIGPVCSGKYT